jgi:hypothetical protein
MRHAGDGVAKGTRNVRHAKWRQESRRQGNPGKSFFGAIWNDLPRFDCGDPGWVVPEMIPIHGSDRQDLMKCLFAMVYVLQVPRVPGLMQSIRPATPTWMIHLFIIQRK